MYQPALGPGYPSAARICGSRYDWRERQPNHSRSMLEGLLLSMAGGLLGLAFAATTIRTTLHLLPDSMPRINSVSMNPIVAGFAVLVAIATGVLCSLAPAFAAVRTI